MRALAIIFVISKSKINGRQKLKFVLAFAAVTRRVDKA